MEKNDVAIYYLLLWHLLFAVAIHYLGHMLFVGSILLWSTIDTNRYTEILDPRSQKLRVSHQKKKKCRERARKFWERASFSKSLLACLSSICGQCKLKLPCHFQWTWHSSGFLPARSFALCSFFCDIQPPGQGCVLTVFYQCCTPNRFLQMNAG